MLQSCPHIRTKSIVIIIENANKSNGFGQSMGGTSTSRSKGWGYHEIEQEASSLVDISHRQVYCLELGGSIISKSSKKLNVLLNGFLTKRPPPIDKPRQASFACRGHSFSVQHHIPVDFRAVVTVHRQVHPIRPPHGVAVGFISFSSHGPPAADSVPPGCFWLPGRPGQKATDSGVPLRHLMALGSCRSGAGANKRGCLAAARRLQTYIFTSALPYSPFPTDIPTGTGRSPLL